MLKVSTSNVALPRIVVGKMFESRSWALHAAAVRIVVKQQSMGSSRALMKHGPPTACPGWASAAKKNEVSAPPPPASGTTSSPPRAGSRYAHMPGAERIRESRVPRLQLALFGMTLRVLSFTSYESSSSRSASMTMSRRATPRLTAFCTAITAPLRQRVPSSGPHGAPAGSCPCKEWKWLTYALLIIPSRTPGIRTGCSVRPMSSGDSASMGPAMASVWSAPESQSPRNLATCGSAPALSSTIDAFLTLSPAASAKSSSTTRPTRTSRIAAPSSAVGCKEKTTRPRSCSANVDVEMKDVRAVPCSSLPLPAVTSRPVLSRLASRAPGTSRAVRKRRPMRRPRAWTCGLPDSSHLPGTPVRSDAMARLNLSASDMRSSARSNCTTDGLPATRSTAGTRSVAKLCPWAPTDATNAST
mmetsp:Transcript_6459/g.19106  ORF Transcript_6459/g.19106 Transcript_6459/m.19106 type:complete len:415 (-) Transcript_6459:208-1452(-)